MAPTGPRTSIRCLRVHRMTREPCSPLSPRSSSGTGLGVRPLCSLLAMCRCGRAPEQHSDLSVAHGARKLCGGCARRITECPCRTYECMAARDHVARCRGEREGGIHTRHCCSRRERERTSCQERFDKASVPLERGDVQSTHGRLRACHSDQSDAAPRADGRIPPGTVSHPARSAVSGASVSTAVRQSRRPWH